MSEAPLDEINSPIFKLNSTNNYVIEEIRQKG